MSSMGAAPACDLQVSRATSPRCPSSCARSCAGTLESEVILVPGACQGWAQLRRRNLHGDRHRQGDPWAPAIVQWKGPGERDARKKWEALARAAAKQSRRIRPGHWTSRTAASWPPGSSLTDEAGRWRCLHGGDGSLRYSRSPGPVRTGRADRAHRGPEGGIRPETARSWWTQVRPRSSWETVLRSARLP